jgi:HK97 gp10 family phage protein
MSQARLTSIQRFKQLTGDLQNEIRRDAIAELNLAADELVATMKMVAPLGATGNLRKSIRKGPGKRPTQVRVMAGGELTTVALRRGATYEREVRIGSGDTAGIARKAGGAGVTYDYARGVEFGTQDASAHPFFFPVYRLRKKRIRSRLKRKITANVKKRSA